MEIQVWSDKEMVDNMIIKPFKFLKKVAKAVVTFVSKKPYTEFERDATQVDLAPITENDRNEETRELALVQEKIRGPRYEPEYCAIGVELIGDLNDYEYISDGKRMCFINYITGNRVYSGETLFRDLKSRMMNDNDIGKYDT